MNISRIKLVVRNFLKLSWLFLLIACSAPANRNGASIGFVKAEHDFGSLIFKKKVECHFEYSNPGEKVLMVNDVKTTCGCTAARWTRTPAKPGKSGMINIGYDTEFPGIFHKEIHVHYNGPGSPVVLKIKGEVQYPDDLQAKK